MDTYQQTLAAAQAEDPTITGVHGNVHRADVHEGFPWDWTVDFTTAAAPTGDMAMSSLEYGTAATHAEAVAAAASVVSEAVAR